MDFANTEEAFAISELGTQFFFKSSEKFFLPDLENSSLSTPSFALSTDQSFLEAASILEVISVA